MADLYSISEVLIRARDCSISALTAGQGTPLVFLHGIGSAAESWRNQIAFFSADYRVVAWDAPGYGRSTPIAQTQPDVSDYAARLKSLLDALSISQAHICGHSLGSLIAARFARLFPDCILTLTLASCAIGHAGLPSEERQRLLQSRIDDIRNLGPAAMAQKRGPRLVTENAPAVLREQVVKTMAGVDPDGYCQAARMLSCGNMLEDVALLPAAMPVQVVYGRDDVITPEAANRRVAEARPSTAITAVAQAGHAVYLEQPDAFNDVLERFLERSNG